LRIFFSPPYSGGLNSSFLRLSRVDRKEKKMTRVRRVIVVEGYQCAFCLEVYQTQKEALNCQQIDSADSLSKRFASQLREKNKARYLTPVPASSENSP
jgi:hypothetical protein